MADIPDAKVADPEAGTGPTTEVRAVVASRAWNRSYLPERGKRIAYEGRH